MIEPQRFERSAEPWVDLNQKILILHLERIERLLERHARSSRSGEATAEAEDPPAAIETDERVASQLAAVEAEMASPSALSVLSATFGLSPFERDLLLLVAGPDLDTGFAERCRAALGDGAAKGPTFGLALAALDEGHWSALSPAAPLRYWRMLSFGGSSEPHGGLTSSPLAIDERVLHYLVGVQHLDERLVGLVESVALPDAGSETRLVASHRALVESIAKAWQASGDSRPQLVELVGADRAAERVILHNVAAELGLDLCRLRAADLPSAATELDELVRRWDREAALGGRVLWIEARQTGGCGDGEEPAWKRAVVRMADALRSALVVSGPDPLPPGDRSRRLLRLGLPTADEQRSLWRECLASARLVDGEALSDGSVEYQLDALTSQFQLDLDGIRSAGRTAADCLATARQGEDRADETADAQQVWRELWHACRLESRPSLGSLAQEIEPRAGWDDLVLPERQRSVLQRLAAQVRQRYRVYERWGFAGRSARGLGISALLAGGSGTGKTMAAEVLAGDLDLDLYRIDLSAVISKYIGETEKNLSQVFDAAEGSGSMLLFDEADALFGKRSEVKDSHDRYANIEVSYLLQRMEAYRGLALLTTNRRNALDSAFLRRLRFIVDFPFPDAAARAEIWRRIFPSETPLGAIDVDKLARLTVTGGQIRNIALVAAFAAADEDRPVDMGHLLEAARVELEKVQKPLSEAEVRGWVEPRER